MNKSRKQFEEEYRKRSTLDEVDIFKIDSESDDYYYLETRCAWHWWQASRESLEVELPKSLNDNCDYSRGFDHGLYIFRDALISNGVKVK